ncbi:MAG: glycosyltransferase family 4 protein [Ignavibacteriales bacterium]|nr:glycosyltransferase family 4 protein [Ignavibacteriales bacterium]
MNILVFNWQDIRNPLGGGAEVHFHEIFKRLSTRGHRVTLFCCEVEELPSEETIDGIRVIREGSRNLFNFYVRRRYERQFRRERFDVVVDDVNKIPFFTPNFIREPLVGIVHHLFGAGIFREVSPQYGLYVYASERRAMRVYRRTPMAVVSESTKGELVRNGFRPANICLVQNAVDHSVYRPTRSVKEQTGGVFHIGYLGRIKKYKSVDHLIRAFALVRSECSRVALTIVGDGDARADLESLAHQLGVSDAVRFTRHVPTEEKVRLLNAMDAVVNTSVKEGWGLTVIEANACGVPVVASDVPGLRDSVVDGKTGLLYEYGNVKQLAEKILVMIRDQNLRLQCAAESIRWAQSFQWEHSADAMERALERVIEKRQLD